MTSAPFTFHLHPSPIGEVLIVSGADGIVTLHPLRDDLSASLSGLEHQLDAALAPDDTTATARAAGAQLDEYFAGERTDFDLPLDWRLVRGFTLDALQAVCRIPYGETAGYGEVAIDAGRPRAARAVGTACATTPFSIVVPVHRVVRADGSLGEYGGHPEIKRFLVDLERDRPVAGE
ncbi:methylated-DNA--[protein]-cysteine S-methyltransferase [Microbacterium terricola]|uniref:Methylated-DNA--protein-cysteine methyltransferase n=1 Tax=Microbacterium terricola TaxID=344163 RepID=A0ABM8E0A3_9MICO|nr:methylated-DNA--[protein]-cysteine S-methyltransferase [Microbacterium terricola]UYK41027.1 methylated-DNA--[protein]-cysteine S-methyltransferase [Microbacterium terricola]BDV31216.1 methylated-DNA--protein-cysteine methyltransferase [Microbacterium terricola]